MDNFLCKNHWGSPTLTLLNVLNVFNVINVLRMPKDPSLACWALFPYGLASIYRIRACYWFLFSACSCYPISQILFLKDVER